MTDPAPQKSLAEFIDAAVQEYASQTGQSALPTGFVAMVEIIADDGDYVAVIAEPDAQPIWRTLGYVRYLSEWYSDDAQVGMALLYGDDEDDD